MYGDMQFFSPILLVEYGDMQFFSPILLVEVEKNLLIR
jgi:hypothetical protein